MSSIRRFVAENSRTALRQVREQLGGDAIILSNRSVEGGVEIVAAPASAVDALTRPIQSEAPVPAVVEPQVAADAQAGSGLHRFASLFARRAASSKSDPTRQGDSAVAPPTSTTAAASAYAEGSTGTFAEHLQAAHGDSEDFVARIAPAAVALSRPQAVATSAAMVSETTIASQPTSASPDLAFEPVVQPVATPLALVAQSLAMDRPAIEVPLVMPPSIADISAVVKREVNEEVSRGIARELGRDVVTDMTRDVAREVTREVTLSVNADVARQFQALHAEINEKLATVSWTDAMRRQPGRTKLMQELILAGFSPSLSRHIQERLPADFSHDEAIAWAQSILRRNLPVAVNADESIDAGGVFALVGPTGVGKTTTVAKLAARFVLKHGADQLALITTDGFRIGAQDQLRIYGKILGIPVHTIHDQASLTSAIEHFSDKKLVLIDTAGLGQRDERVAEQIAMLRGAKAKRLVVLNATADAQTLDHVIATFADRDFAGCVITKTDEAARVGPVLDAVIRHRLKIHHVSTGQRVPEDLERPDVQDLVAQALVRRAPRPAFEVQPDDAPVWMAAMAEQAHALAPDLIDAGAAHA